MKILGIGVDIVENKRIHHFKNVHEEMNAKEKCRANDTMFREAKKCITICRIREI